MAPKCLPNPQLLFFPFDLVIWWRTNNKKRTKKKIS